MRTTRIYKASLAAVTAILMVAVPLTAVFADASFYFNDDFSTGYNIDASQTTNVKTANGSEYLVVGALNGTVTSNVLNQVSGDVVSAKISAQMTLPIGSFVDFYISNDNGANWHPIDRNVNYTFPTPGSQLRWRVYISRADLNTTPYLDSISIQYTIAGATTGAPTSPYNYYGGSGATLGSSGLGLADPQDMVCSTLNFLGISCAAPAPTHPKTTIKPLSFDIFGNPSSTDEDETVDGAAKTTTKDLAGNDINLVKVPNDPTIYEIDHGLKHAFPTITIFAAYGYTTDMIQTITPAQLAKYPRADLVKVNGSNQIYYLTEGGMVRPIPNQTVFASYGDRMEDVIVISQKEFNFYPQNQYVFLETPLNRDVFQLTNGSKRYLTPMAVTRLQIPADQIAPINQTELDTYKTLPPVVD